MFTSASWSEVPAEVVGDERRLRQVLMNLLNNAIKYTREGGVALKVGMHGERLRFVVEDTGIGIRRAHVAKIFAISSTRCARTAPGPRGRALGSLSASAWWRSWAGRSRSRAPRVSAAASDSMWRCRYPRDRHPRSWPRRPPSGASSGSMARDAGPWSWTTSRTGVPSCAACSARSGSRSIRPDAGRTRSARPLA